MSSPPRQIDIQVMVWGSSRSEAVYRPQPWRRSSHERAVSRSCTGSAPRPPPPVASRSHILPPNDVNARCRSASVCMTTVAGTTTPAARQRSQERNLSWQMRTVSGDGRKVRACTSPRWSERNRTSASFCACTRSTPSSSMMSFSTSRYAESLARGTRYRLSVSARMSRNSSASVPTSSRVRGQGRSEPTKLVDGEPPAPVIRIRFNAGPRGSS
jgi:hypothetical protein